MTLCKHTTHDIPVDALMKVLTDPCRRTVLSYLRTKDTDIAILDELAGYVQNNVEAIRSHYQAQIVLVHQHLPALADHRLIEYDTRHQTIRYRESTVGEAFLKVTAQGE
ncbi:DUF7344 domain-containing protein [Haladaptatus halobius]|uniref:DUF7344 domain-containing protein n=1 Tax=Haladaptatus halobius TaxID=2884875 RepID=UPI001D0A1451|nr:hypothetical protein [Haladaptatus halobius]